jgi:hypothetical protein
MPVEQTGNIDWEMSNNTLRRLESKQTGGRNGFNASHDIGDRIERNRMRERALPGTLTGEVKRNALELFWVILRRIRAVPGTRRSLLWLE